MVEIKVDEKNLRILFNGKEKLVLSIGGEYFAVGKGSNSYEMSRGSFIIKETIDFKKPLKIQSFDYSKEGASIEFDEGELFLTIEGDKIKFTPKGLGGYTKMWLTIPSSQDEGYYGSGELFTEFNLKGKVSQVWVAEHINLKQTTKKLLKHVIGIKNARRCGKLKNYETYYAQPTFVSSDRYCYHSLTTARSVFDFKQKDKVIVQTDEIAPFYIIYGEDFEKLMTNLTEVVGRQPALPDWVYDGQILGIQGGTDIMLDKYNKVIEHNGKVNGIWIQDWEGRRVTAVGKQLFWNWVWDKELYPNLDNVIKDLNKKGCKVLGYCNPFLAIEKPLYQEATQKGYCVKDKEGKDYLVKITTFPAAMLDLTNPEAYAWIKNIIKENLIKFGFSGWMADFGEYLPTDCVLFSGEDAEKVHNTWPARWAQLNREAVEESGKLGEIMFFTRAGYSNSPRYSTMMWNGDNHPDFSMDFGLPSIIPAMLSLTICGFGLSHSDIGGYTTVFNLKRDMEVYKRWFEMNVFSPLMRGHEGLNPDLNVQFDANEDILTFSAKMSRIHVALKDYLKEAVEKNAKEGVGVVRPLFFYYSDETSKFEGHEYLLGRDILVAPVLRPKATTRKVFLPDDEWIHLWSQKEYKGGEYVVDAPLGEIPVFIRKNAKSDVLEKLLKEI